MTSQQLADISATDFSKGAADDPGVANFYEKVLAELSACEDRADELGLLTNKSRKLQLSIAGVGIIAGSIVVPALAAKAAAKSTIAAWGGVAGAANAGQAALTTSGFSAEQAVAAQRDFQQRVANHIDTLSNVTTGAQATTFLIKLRLICQITLPVDGPKGAGGANGTPGT
jgi:hypothetical protein